MDQRHLNKPKTGHDVKRCDPKNLSNVQAYQVLLVIEAMLAITVQYRHEAAISLCATEGFLLLF